MKKVIQFHASLDEVLDLVRTACELHELNACVVKAHPFSVVVADFNHITPLRFSDPSIREIMLTVDPPDLKVSTSGQLYDRNPSFLIFDIPRISDEGLRQVGLSACTDNENHAVIWRRILRELRSNLKFGVTAINPASGATGFYKQFGYTSDAERLELSGVQMLPVAGGNIIRLKGEGDEMAK